MLNDSPGNDLTGAGSQYVSCLLNFFGIGEFDYERIRSRVDYPNKYDADRAATQQLISPQQQAAITAAWEKRVATLETTKLGGGIGFHGWIREWDNSGPRHLSWGCVVMHLNDIERLYDQIPEGTMVVIR